MPVGSPASSTTAAAPGEERKAEAKKGRIWGNLMVIWALVFLT
ncbi:rCG45151, partial [Rattus norvegicus]